MPELITAKAIEERVGELARWISRDYEGLDVHAVVVLTGGYVFAADLLRRLEPKVRGRTCVDFVRVSSYGAEKKSSGRVQVTSAGVPVEDLFKDKNVLFLDDVLETGLTLQRLTRLAFRCGATTVRAAVLVHKMAGKLRPPPTTRYVGFVEEDDVFLYGYGMDIGDGEQGRMSPSVWAALHEPRTS